VLRVAALAIAALLVLIAAIRFGWVSGVFTEATGFIKSRYTAVVQSAKDSYTAHFDQAETIERLLEENRLLQEQKETIGALASEIKNIAKLRGYEVPLGYKMVTVRAISYAEIPNMQKVLIDYGDINDSEVRGLIFNNQSAGIAIKATGSYSKAILNGDPDCSYSVSIGEFEAPGIASGKSDQEMIVRYIPAWMTIREGDEVVTNGLDGIFFAGVKVGVVSKVNRLNAYIEAIVKPYYGSFNPGYFYLVESVR
jgi:rod shape-determining protein MreC